MTKKTFIALADALRDHNAALSDRQINILADFCASQNPRFNRSVWIAYICNSAKGSSGETDTHWPVPQSAYKQEKELTRQAKEGRKSVKRIP